MHPLPEAPNPVSLAHQRTSNNHAKSCVALGNTLNRQSIPRLYGRSRLPISIHQVLQCTCVGVFNRCYMETAKSYSFLGSGATFTEEERDELITRSSCA